MSVFTGIRVDNGKEVTGDYCRCEFDGCWIGHKDKSGYWESKVIPGSVRTSEGDKE